MTEKKGSNIWMLSNACYVNLNIGKVFCIQDNVVKEFAFGKQKYAPRILELFLHEQGKRLTYDEIIKYAWGNKGKEPAITAFDHDVHLHVGKLVAMGELAKYIKNHPTVGYTFDCPGLREIDSIPVLSQTSPMSYYEMLWKNHCMAQERDEASDEHIRELIDVYAVPEFVSGVANDENARRISTPFSDLNHYIYITAGSGFGKTAVLRVILLTSIVNTLVENESAVVSINSREKLAEYGTIREALFGDRQKRFFPVFIPSSGINKKPNSDVLDLAEGRMVPGFENMVREAHDAGNLLFLIDSIDEVEQGRKRNDFVDGIQQLLKDTYPNAKAIITSRFLGRKKLPFVYRSIGIKRLSKEAIGKIIRGMLSHKSAAELVDTIAWITSNRQLKTLAENPFMLETIINKRDRFSVNQNLAAIIEKIIRHRWDKTGYDIETQDIMLLLGYLACNFIFGEKEGVSFLEVRHEFMEAERLLKKYGSSIEISSGNMDSFLHALSSQSGILNVICNSDVEEYVFQDDLVMCWLAANYVRNVLTYEVNANTADEMALWKNAVKIAEVFDSLTCEQCSLSANVVETIVLTIVQWSEAGQGRRHLPISVLYYMLFMSVTSKSTEERANLKKGFQNLLYNVYGSSMFTNNPRTDSYYRLIVSVLKSL